MKQDTIQRDFKKDMIDIFTDKVDHSFFEILLKKKSTLILSLKAQSLMSNEDMIIAFATFTMIKKNNKICRVIIDYFGCTEASPKKIIPSFNKERFHGKGISKLLINMIQVISNTLCNDKDNVILLKCTDEYQSYYESVGFQKKQTKILNGYKFLM